MRKIQGFTLIELMVTVAIAAIVMGVAIPSFNMAMLNNSSTALGSELSVALNYARSEAIKRAKRVSICASDNGTTCLPANNWGKGWLVFVDDANSDAATTVTIGTVLRYWDDLPQKTNVSALKGGAINIQFLRFTSAGILARDNGADNQARNFLAYVNGCKGKSSLNIVVGFSGMVSPTKINCP